MKRSPQSRFLVLGLVALICGGLVRFSLMKSSPDSSSAHTEEWYVGSYVPGQPGYTPKWLEVRADRTFVLRSFFDGGLVIDGKFSHEWTESGHWYSESTDRVVLVVESETKIEPLYYVSLFKETPRGAGLFISKKSTDRASWEDGERFLNLKEPNQTLQPTALLGRG